MRRGELKCSLNITRKLTRCIRSGYYGNRIKSLHRISTYSSKLKTTMLNIKIAKKKKQQQIRLYSLWFCIFRSPPGNEWIWFVLCWVSSSRMRKVSRAWFWIPSRHPFPFILLTRRPSAVVQSPIRLYELSWLLCSLTFYTRKCACLIHALEARKREVYVCATGRQARGSLIAALEVIERRDYSSPLIGYERRFSPPVAHLNCNNSAHLND